MKTVELNSTQAFFFLGFRKRINFLGLQMEVRQQLRLPAFRLGPIFLQFNGGRACGFESLECAGLLVGPIRMTPEPGSN